MVRLDTERAPSRDLGLSLMSIRSRYGHPRPMREQGRMSEMSGASRLYHALKSVDSAPPALWYIEDTPEPYRAEQARRLYGAGLDINPTDPTVEHYQSEIQRLRLLVREAVSENLRLLAVMQETMNRRFRRYIESHPEREQFRLTDKEIEEIKHLVTFSHRVTESQKK